MAIGIRVGSNTSGTRNLQPWLIESNYKQVILHLGGIYDKKSYDDDGRIEYVSRRAMPKRSVTNRVSGASSSFGSYNSQKERTGLVGNTPKVHYKNSLGYASKTNGVAEQTVVYNAGLFQNGSYIVLKRVLDEETKETDYWTLGVVERANLSVTSDDIVIGYVKNSFVTQIWQSDIYVTKPPEQQVVPPGTVVDHPFKVKYSEPVMDGETVVTAGYFYVIPGTINNIVPSNMTITQAPNNYYVYLKATFQTEYPHAATTVIEFSATEKTDTDTAGYLKLAKTTVGGTVTQYVLGSVWSERHKYTEPNSATYYYYRI